MPSLVIHPKGLEGHKNFLLDVDEGASGGAVRGQVASRLCVAAPTIRLAHDGKTLKLGPSLEEQGVHNLSTVVVMVVDTMEEAKVEKAPTPVALDAAGGGGDGGGGGGGGEGAGYPSMESPKVGAGATSGADAGDAVDLPPNTVKVYGDVPDSPRVEEALESSMCLYGRVSTVARVPVSPSAPAPSHSEFLVSYAEPGGATTAVKAGSVMLFGKALNIVGVKGSSKTKLVVAGALAAGITAGRTGVRAVKGMDDKLGASRRVKEAAGKVAQSATEFGDRTGITKTVGKVGKKLDEATTTVVSAASTRLTALDDKLRISETTKKGVQRARAKTSELATKAMSVKAVSKSVAGVSNLWRRVKTGVTSTVKAAQHKADQRERSASGTLLPAVPPPPLPPAAAPAPAPPAAPAVTAVESPEEMDLDGML